MNHSNADVAASVREQLSALSDGELQSSTEVAAACAAWKGDAAMRATWHGYHLIGDVLRSEDLASKPMRDSAFLQALRERLAMEPVVLAPAAEPAPPLRRTGSDAGSGQRGRHRTWGIPAAVAAGFVAVAGALLVTRAPAPVQIVATPTAPAPAPTVIKAADPEPTVVAAGPRNRVYLRDPQLDRYLAAHKQFGGSTAVQVPGLRQVYDEAPGR